MKAISLWQPWATLLVCGAKKNETRSWPTAFRGTLAVHAAKKWTRELRGLCLESPTFRACLNPLRHPHATDFSLDRALGAILPLGMIVGTVEVVACMEIRADNRPDAQECEFGDYAPGRFMWITKNQRRFAEPIPFTGHQGFFDVPDALIGGAS